MKLLLAPMEGLIDPYLRKILTRIGHYDWCVSEFIRVTDRVFPRRVFHRSVPELKQGGRTDSGTPVVVQLMGNDPSVLAGNAVRVVEHGALGIDLNFGCPSKTVNKKRVGASLLEEPERINEITAEVRRAVAAEIPVTAKIRLGYDHPDHAVEIAQGIEAAGADLITVHARTRADGYRAPARWEWLAKIREAVSFPVVANGDINDVESFRQCREISGCDHFMVGRGAVHNPYLAQHLHQSEAGEEVSEVAWSEQRALVIELAEMMADAENQRGAATRIKQWLGMWSEQQGGEASLLFEQVRKERELSTITALLQAA
ncbi:hypothetical protein BOW53_12190 [Solemya pervernicosa gill symbiont]|uniref:tRNA-dihydrouridine(16) synthase n=2 Tax=Gammaproteobacteria incertae sedis TaxID=118884 RepID=A0A1T2L2K5_9GAMM|nr:tRNA-dihydrouridine synthase family protein [Candidatus Reidiella endopervernicosa]OOZ39312.1 hypothetical protein BOW53_12190 [Solemya pervernicosa gill symbiont]QKQ25505.1 tRNA-dihydrouridine synthase family protein [Candidatus Reidiella endopervernicosa]